MHAQCWIPAYIGLGSNLEDPAAQVERGFVALGQLPETLFVTRSRRYCSPPLGPQDQPDFVNAVAGVLTLLAPEELLRRLQRLEVELGREQPVRRWGPRIIDFDLLLYGELRMSTPLLTLPHPGLHERVWAVQPLRDIAPDIAVPGHGRVRRLAKRLGAADA